MEEEDGSDVNTVYITDIVEEGNRFGIYKGSRGTFHAISKHACILTYDK